jgi:hypothetical protein
MFREIRCPTGPQRLLFKLNVLQSTRNETDKEAAIEISCSDCKRQARRELGNGVSQVLHRVNLCGTVVSTVIVQDNS